MTTVAAGPTVAADTVPRRADVRALFAARGGAATRAPGHDVPGIATWVLPAATGEPGSRNAEPLTVRIALSSETAQQVEREAMVLVALRRMNLAALHATIPRHVGTRQLDGLPVSLASPVPGRPMTPAPRSVGWPPEGRARSDLEAATRWLGILQEETASAPVRSTWAGDVAAALARRWNGHPVASAASARAVLAAQRLDPVALPTTVVHGDFWHGNLRVADGAVTGVVGWSAAEYDGCPLRDVVRFPLEYTCRRHHPATRVDDDHRPPACDIGRTLLGGGRYPRLVREVLRAELARLGVPVGLWYDAALVGLAALASEDHDEDRAAGHLRLLACLPLPGHPLLRRTT